MKKKKDFQVEGRKIVHLTQIRIKLANKNPLNAFCEKQFESWKCRTKETYVFSSHFRFVSLMTKSLDLLSIAHTFKRFDGF
jgi:hypothetical protein